MSDKDKILVWRFKMAVFSIVWLGCLYGFVQSFGNASAFVNAAVRVPGQVVALNAGGSHPQIEFVTKEGERVSYPQGGWIGGFRVGDHVTVLYLEKSPRKTASIDRTGAIWFWPILLLIFIVGIPILFLWNTFYKPKSGNGKWKISAQVRPISWSDGGKRGNR
jgi:Protein of unknown function (DUF3592)